MNNKFWGGTFGFIFFANVLFAQTSNFSYTQTCFGNQTTLVASSTLPDTSIASWKWDLDGNGTYESTGKTVISLITINDTVAVKLKITPKSGSADSVTKNVIIDPLPQVNFFASNLCQGKTATYISQSMIAPGNIAQYKWDFDNNGVDDAIGDTTTYICGPAQTYVTKLTCVSNKGCAAFAQKVTTVYANPVAAFTTANTCLGDNTMFTNTSTITNPDHYLWDFGDSKGTTTTGNGDALHIFGSADLYSVQMIAVSQAGCRDTVSAQITINPLPTAALVYAADSSIFAGQTVNIAVTGGSFSYAWSTGDATDNITVAPETSTNYSCHVVDVNGCFVHLIGTVTVKEIPDTVIVKSNLLTPNDDNINDKLVIDDIAAYSSCDLMIYNAWNDEVYSMKGYNNEWKGTNSTGANLPAGAYYYIIKCDEKPLLKGNINILR